MQREQVIFDVFCLSEAVSFTLVKFEDMRDMNTVQQPLGLLLRHHHIFVALKDRQRNRNLFRMIKRRPGIILFFRFRKSSGQAFSVMQLQLPGRTGQSEQIRHTVKRSARGINLRIPGENVQHGEPAGAAAGDEQSFRIGKAFLPEKFCHCYRVFRVIFAPVSV